MRSKRRSLQVALARKRSEVSRDSYEDFSFSITSLPSVYMMHNFTLLNQQKLRARDACRTRTPHMILAGELSFTRSVNAQSTGVMAHNIVCMCVLFDHTCRDLVYIPSVFIVPNVRNLTIITESFNF